MLPPSNEVWGKVMFLHLSVNLFTAGIGWLPSMHPRSHDWGVCIQGVCLQGRCLPPAGYASGGMSASRGVLHPGVCIQLGVCLQGGWEDPPMGYYRIRLTSEIPTGMHSCAKRDINMIHRGMGKDTKFLDLLLQAKAIR